MSKNKNQPKKYLSYALIAVAGFGALLTIVIELSHIYPWIMELCGIGSSACADVQSTQFARILGVSVSYLGLLAYVTFILFCIYAPKYTLPLAAALLGAEFYFLWVMNQVLHMYCMFCLIQFGTVIVLFTLTMVWHKNEREFALPGKMLSVPVVAILVFVSLTLPVKMRAQDVAQSSGELVTYTGDPNSVMRVELFSDYQCGFCNRLEPEIDKMIKEHPDLLIVFRDFIISSHSLSPLAVSYANAVAFSKGRETFVKTRREMFENQKRLREYLKEHLPEVEFTEDLKARIRAKVDEDLARAKSLDVFQTPTMAIYRGNDLVQVIRGYTKYERFSKFLKQ